MLRLTGIILIISTSGLAGYLVSRTFLCRPAELRELRHAFSVLHTEILYSSTLLPQALDRAASMVGPAVGGIFRWAARSLSTMEGCTPREAWRLAVEAIYPDTALTPEDRAILLEFGDCLGASSREDQERHLMRVQELLAMCEARALEDRDRYSRMWQYLGVAVGLMLVLLLY